MLKLWKVEQLLVGPDCQFDISTTSIKSQLKLSSIDIVGSITVNSLVALLQDVDVEVLQIMNGSNILNMGNFTPSASQVGQIIQCVM